MPSGSMPQKLIIKGGTGLSLHDRFTRLSQEPVISQPPTPPRKKSTLPRSDYGDRPIYQPKPSSYLPPPPPPQNHPRYDLEDDDEQVEYHHQPRMRYGYNNQHRHSMRSQSEVERRNGLFAAALNIKKRAISHRLGLRRPTYYSQQFNNVTPYFPRGRYGGGRSTRGWGRASRGAGYSPWRRFGNNQRWFSTHSLTSDGTTGRRWRPRGGRGRGGGRGRFQRNWNNQPKMSKEELDAQLDSYMKDTKSVLDKELENYMEQ